MTNHWWIGISFLLAGLICSVCGIWRFVFYDRWWDYVIATVLLLSVPVWAYFGVSMVTFGL